MLSAAAQSRRFRVPEVRTPCEFADLPWRLNTGAPPFVLDRSAETLTIPSKATGFVVGPEGGFSDGERRLIREWAWPRVRLGPNVLRVETAVLAALAVLGHATCDTRES